MYAACVGVPIVLTALLVVPEPAAACGKGACVPGFLAPREGATIPANAPALVYSARGWENVVGDGAPVVLRVAGAAESVPLAVEAADATGTHLVRLAAPLTEGATYEVGHAQPTCNETLEVDKETFFVKQTFVAGASAPLPTTAGTLSGETAATTDTTYRVVGGSSCSQFTLARVARLSFAPSAELTPYLPVTSLEVSVDGAPVRTSTVGLDLQGGDGGARPTLELYASCEAEDLRARGGDPGLTPATHAVVVQARVAGVAEADQPAPLTTTIDLSCDGAEALPAASNTAPEGEAAGCGVSAGPAPSHPRGLGSLGAFGVFGGLVGIAFLRRRRH